MTLKLRALLRKFSFDVAQNEALPFNKIPGPRGFLGIGNFYKYFKVFGEFWFQWNLSSNIDDKTWQANTVSTSCIEAVWWSMRNSVRSFVSGWFPVFRSFGCLSRMTLRKYSLRVRETFPVVVVTSLLRSIEKIDRRFIDQPGYLQRKLTT